ncbi:MULTISPECIES: hypothetical protein [unclassified Acinetobacter]|uniref:hypothetical protein n=1 Tax=unclassified Acinetobacter TaxID=196816 RepID=UPI002446F5CA|nr:MULTISPECIES: hypothetical protein [unclassified Acinetobacter]MDH0030418.1 hypothetical protein [Acinetobacter sp. GD04021]MDH0885693.1 hypothetical protein [Acinetobacter sp. GD03873]MDH1081991.1 hypothetical protein [Acinetobacter sp. GD03983]MDH2188979.1 hypothetical protein [Acinetobacter sp. GD03645]MDH2202460.1 hypothetical protein [Acinetobacter sp. GD03647]
MDITKSLKSLLISFVILTTLVAILFWFYLNIQASLIVSAQQADIRLPQSLATKIQVGDHLQVKSEGKLNTTLDINRTLQLPLTGKYLADLSFEVETPITVDINYETLLKVDEVMPIETSTDLIYQNKLLPKFPLKLNVPVKLDLPFQLKRRYTVPVKIVFDGPVYFAFDESVNLPVKHQFKPSFYMNDAINMNNISSFNATMFNSVQQTKANLDMQMDLPLRNVHP